MAAEPAPKLEVLALGGGERGFEPGDLGTMVALELGELGGQRAHDVALRRWLDGLELRFAWGRRGALLPGAELLDPGSER